MKNFAKEEKLGLWKGTFVEPEKWRKAKLISYIITRWFFLKDYSI